MEYHVPVLLHECIDGLELKKDGVYVDVTFGGGGHSKEILNQLEGGKLFVFDQDIDAKNNVWDDERLVFINQNFRHLKRYLKLYGVKQVDGILADLGVSSYQIDTPERGFSTRFDANLDMRMNKDGGFTAADILNTYSAAQLQDIFSKYGEVRNAKTLARTITDARNEGNINTIDELKIVINDLPKGNVNRYLAQVFQALRIEVNQEMEALQEMLNDAIEVLKPGGRLVVMSYHSLEDRVVKNFIRSGNETGEIEKDMFGRGNAPLKAINKKPLMASPEQVKENPRARSSKLRVAEKV